MSSRGGARPGAGRKINGTNSATREAIEAARQGGILPLDYLLGVMRDEGADEVKRIDCAKAAAQYIHPKLSAIDAKVEHGGELSINEIRLVGPDEG